MQIIMTKRNEYAIVKNADEAKMLQRDGFVPVATLKDEDDAKAYVKSSGIKGKQRK